MKKINVYVAYSIPKSHPSPILRFESMNYFFHQFNLKTHFTPPRHWPSVQSSFRATQKEQFVTWKRRYNPLLAGWCVVNGVACLNQFTRVIAVLSSSKVPLLPQLVFWQSATSPVDSRQSESQWIFHTQTGMALNGDNKRKCKIFYFLDTFLLIIPRAITMVISSWDGLWLSSLSVGCCNTLSWKTGGDSTLTGSWDFSLALCLGDMLQNLWR